MPWFEGPEVIIGVAPGRFENINGELFAYECKWNPRRKAKLPQSFSEKYNLKSFKVINPDTINQLFEDGDHEQ